MNTSVVRLAKMKTIALLLVIAASASALDWSDLRVKWNTWLLDPFRWNSYYGIPRTVDAAVSAKWVGVTGINTTWVTIYCMADDPRFCTLYDSYHHIAGIQVGILASDVANMQSIYDMSKFDMYQKKTIFGQETWTATAYTVDPDVIATGGRSDWDNLTGTAGVWFETTTGYVAIPRYVTELDSIWVKQACISEMGTHYYYDMYPTTECENFLPWSLLYQDGELSAVLLQAFGSVTYTDRNWFEWVPSFAIKPTIPTTPQCLIDWVADYSVISLHIYFTSEPWNISC